jgi:membrane-bound serine protease (ClpP class)
VIDVSGPLDGQAVAFIAETIERSADQGAEAVIIQLDSPGVVAEESDWAELMDLIADPPVPVTAWVGPAPAVAYGGSFSLAKSTQITLAAPGVEVGFAAPTFIAGDGSDTEVTTVESPIEDVVDMVVPSIQQVVGALDGAEVQVGGDTRTLALGEGTEVVFHKPGYWARFLRLAVTPEAAFMFLVAGLTVAAFEFFAIGPGVAAAVAAASLFLASYGIATLPVRWWALALVGLGWWAMTDSYQRGSVAVLTGLGTVLTLIGGLFYVDGAPQLTVNPVVIAVIVLVVLFFYAIAMPTVARSRFSTRTIGRDHLVGSRATALVDFGPDGEVDIAGARWRASAHREAGIRQGDVVRIAEVDGLVLEVEPLAPHAPKARENQA